MPFTISSQPYLDTYNKCYKNILTVNQLPHGPLRKLIHRIMMPRLSPFQVSAACNPIENCVLAIIIPNHYGAMNRMQCHDKNGQCLMTPNEIPFLYDYLMNNGYQIETQLTNMMNQSEVKIGGNRNMVCMATYYGHKHPNITYMR